MVSSPRVHSRPAILQESVQGYPAFHERRQRSVYVSTEEMSALDIVSLMQRMAGQLPWLGRCAECVDTTDIGAQHSLLGLLRSEMWAAEVLPPVPARARRRKKSEPER